MTEDGAPNISPQGEKSCKSPEGDSAGEIVKLRDEMQQQFAAMKQSFEDTIKIKDETIAQLKKSNEALEAALVRSTTMPPTPEAAKPPTEEELREKQIAELSQQTLHYMKVIQ